MRKKIDEKITTLIENCVYTNERSMFIIVGDRSRDQIANLYYLYNKVNSGKKLNILWCYKKDLGFSSHAKKKIRKIKNSQGNALQNTENNFDLFISSTEIRYCYYSDTQKILGNTYGMLILQDFSAITPNVLCRTIETVNGGGMIILLLNNMTSLKQLYTLTMDVHTRYRTESHQDLEPRFNERFILSISDLKNCIVMDDEMNILPISSHIQEIKAIQKKIDITQENALLSDQDRELLDLKSSLKDRLPIGPLVQECKTIDQAKCVMSMVDSIAEKAMKSTISITAGRGRGKSSAMGIAISSAIAYGLSNIFVTAPSPENLKTFFEFVVKGLFAMGYKEHKDFEIQQGTKDEYKNCIVKINIYRDHKQSISYIHPTDFNIVGYAEVLVIDEAAAIPLHIVKKLLGNCLIFMSSTIHGYEGTGRSLSLKLLKQLRAQSSISINNNQTKSASGGRILKEIKLEQAIRYADNDKVESWLNKLLCLDATLIESMYDGFPHPNDCELYYVNRDTLFSYHKASEAFLNKIMSLFVSSHYKNSPNDLQLLSDAPAHSIFILTQSVNKETSSKSLPDIFCAIQVCEEGDISETTVNNKLSGVLPPGDLIPWTLRNYFRDKVFTKLKGIRVVRIATHPDAQRMGYGTRALQILNEFFEGRIINLEESIKMEELNQRDAININISKENVLMKEELKPKKKLKPLLTKLTDIKPTKVNWLGTSFGLTDELYKFWRKNGFNCLYIKLTENEITGEHSCIMLRPYQDETLEVKSLDNTFENNWLAPFISDFKKRFISLLSLEFREMPIKLALNLVDPPLNQTTSALNDNEDDSNLKELMTKNELNFLITTYDYERLKEYSNKNSNSYQMIVDLIPYLSKLFFLRKFTSLRMNFTHAAILLGFGLQFKSFEQIAKELELQTEQIMANFRKAIKKFVKTIENIYVNEINYNEKQKIKENVKLPEGKLNISLKEELLEENEKLIKETDDSKIKFIQNELNKNKNLSNKKRNREDDA